MNRNNHSEATDEIIGLVFKRSLILIALLAIFIIAIILIRKTLREDKILIEAPVVSPVSVRNLAQAPRVHFTDITRRAGINFSHVTGESQKCAVFWRVSAGLWEVLKKSRAL